MVAELEYSISPHLYVKTANDLLWSVVTIPWKVFVCCEEEHIIYDTVACTAYLTGIGNLHYPTTDQMLVHLSIQQSITILH